MRLVYLDEAGLSNSKEEPFLVVAGVIIDADKKLIAVERHLDKLVERYVPAEHHATFVFHAADLFGGRGRVFTGDKFTVEKRLQLADHMAAIFKRFDLPVALGFLDRKKFPESFSMPEGVKPADLTIAAHATAFMQCTMQVEQWMRREASNEVCMMVAEDNAQSRKIIKDTHQHYQNKRLAKELTGVERMHFPLRKIKEAPLFSEKRPSSALQLADFCAHVFKRHLMGDNRYLRFLDRFIEKVAAEPVLRR